MIVDQSQEVAGMMVDWSRHLNQLGDVCLRQLKYPQAMVRKRCNCIFISLGWVFCLKKQSTQQDYDSRLLQCKPQGFLA
jgi:hypothetical protein